MTADVLDEHAVLQARDDVAAVEVGRDLVLHDPVSERTHHLGTAAALVWRCLDGDTAIGELADDFVAVLGGNRASTVAALGRHVRRFDRAGLLSGTGSADPRPAPSVDAGAPDRLVLVSTDACARRNRAGWVGTIAVASGGKALGIRCNDGELMTILERLLDPVRADVPDPPPNYSVSRARQGRDQVAPHRLRQGCRSLVRSASMQRVLTALWSFLSAYQQCERADRVVVDAVAVVRGDAAVLVPERVRPRLGGAEQALLARGWSVADATPALTSDGTEILIESPTLHIDPAALDAISGIAAEPATAPPVAAPGRYRLAGWAWPESSGGRAVKAAELVAVVDRTVRNRDAVGAETALRGVAAGVDRTGIVPLPVGPVNTALVLDAVGDLLTPMAGLAT